LVAEAGDGPAAFDIVSSPDSPAFELLVTDVVLPRVTGKRLASTIKASLPNIAVVFMSGYTEDAIVNQGVLDPGIHFLSKPFSPDELLERVASALSSRHHSLGASLMISTEDSTLMSALRGTLERSVYRIHEVNTREDVMRLASKVSTDLVLVDFSMDDRDSRPEEARRFMREVQSLLRNAKVVLIDEGDGPLLRKEWPENLAPNAVLPRPVDSAGVLSLIHALLGSNGS
jgi:CheY-like chemotaxis protein